MASRPGLTPITEVIPPLYAGVDLGGTNIKAALVDSQGDCLAFHTEPTHANRGPEGAARRMGQFVLQLAREAHATPDMIARVGLGSPGPLDLDRGCIVRAGNLPGWDNFPLRDRVHQNCGLPVTLTNDANAAAFGEFWVGSGREYDSLVLLTLGTGVGGGIIIGNLSVQGAHSHGSECGHMIVDTSDSARMCPCGHAGHLEAYCSATSLVKAARRSIENGATGSLADAVRAGATLDPILIAQEAESGDQHAYDLIMDVAQWLGIGIVSLMHIIDPEAVIIGGAMTFGQGNNPIGQSFLERIQSEVRHRAFPTLADHTVLRYASLGGDAGSIGAAGLARLAHK